MPKKKKERERERERERSITSRLIILKHDMMSLQMGKLYAALNGEYARGIRAYNMLVIYSHILHKRLRTVSLLSDPGPQAPDEVTLTR